MNSTPIGAEYGEDIRGVVEHAALFRGLSPEASKAVLAIAHKLTWEYGDCIMHQGEAGPGIILIAKGTVEVATETKDAATILLASLTTGAIIGEVGTLLDTEITATVTATASGWGLLLPKTSLLPLLDAYPMVKERLSRLVGVRARQTAAKFNDQSR